SYVHLVAVHDRVALCFLFLFNATATTEIYTLSLHDALPIWPRRMQCGRCNWPPRRSNARRLASVRPRSGPEHWPWPHRGKADRRSEEHTSELQSRGHLVCRLLLEKKNRMIV